MTRRRSTVRPRGRRPFFTAAWCNRSTAAFEADWRRGGTCRRSHFSFGAWDCRAWSPSWQEGIQAGAIPAGSTTLPGLVYRESSRLTRLRSGEPWECKSPGRDQFCSKQITTTVRPRGGTANTGSLNLSAALGGMRVQLAPWAPIFCRRGVVSNAADRQSAVPGAIPGACTNLFMSHSTIS